MYKNPSILLINGLNDRSKDLIRKVSMGSKSSELFIIDLAFLPQSKVNYELYCKEISLNRNIIIKNIYDLLAGDKLTENVHKEVCMNPDSKLEQEGYVKYPVANVNNAYRYFQNGLYKMYKQFDDNENIIFVDYFADNWKRIKKSHFDSEGIVKKISYMNDLNKVRLETLLDSAGTCYLTQTYGKNGVDGLYYHVKGEFYPKFVQLVSNYILQELRCEFNEKPIVITDQLELFKYIIKGNGTLNVLYSRKYNKEFGALDEIGKDSIIIIDEEFDKIQNYALTGKYVFKINQSHEKWEELLKWSPFIENTDNIITTNSNDLAKDEEGFNLVSFTMVKNEADIIEVFVRHTLKYVDRMFIAVNLPNDATREILNNLVNEGLPITIWDDNDPSFEQNKKTTEAYHEISRKFNFDAMIFIDADEFIYGDINELKNNYTPGQVYQLDRLEYAYLNDVKFNENILEKMTYRREKYQSAKSMIYHDPSNFENYRIGNGSHFVYVNGVQKIDGKLKLKLAHFPYRSVNQFVNKNILNWISLMFNSPELLTARNTIGEHWRNAYKYLLDRNVQISSKELFEYLYKTDDYDTFKAQLIEEPIDVRDIQLTYNSLDNEKSLNYMLIKDFEHALRSFQQNK